MEKTGKINDTHVKYTFGENDNTDSKLCQTIFDSYLTKSTTFIDNNDDK